MGLINRIRALRWLPELYGLSGNDNPPQLIETSSPVVIVHDTSREAELAGIAYVQGTVFIEASAVGKLPASAAVEKVMMTPPGVVNSIDDTATVPWLIGAGAREEVVGDFSSANLYVIPNSDSVNVMTAPLLLGICNAFDSYGAIGNPAQMIFEQKRPVRTPWGSTLAVVATCSAVDAGKGVYFDFLFAIVPLGMAPPGMR